MGDLTVRYRTSSMIDILKETKRKKEGNCTPRSPLVIRIKRSKTTASRRHRSYNKQTEKDDNSVEDLEGLQMKTTCTGEASQRDGNYNLCVKCKKPGLLMYCDGKDCKRCYHKSCTDPPLSDVPLGMWLCVYCLLKKLKFGVHYVSQGIESILDCRNEARKGKFYLVKYKGFPHIHNHWLPSSQLLRNIFNKQQRGQYIEWKHEWTEPHRLLQRRSLVLPEQIDVCSGHGGNNKYCYVEWLVKWKGLGYECSTWEYENANFLCSASGKALIDEFERRRVEARKKPIPDSHIVKDLRVRKNLLKKLSMLADELSIEHNNEFLISVRDIIKHWRKKQDAIFIHDQEAKVKSIMFISHLLSYRRLPFLVISTISSLSKWEAEFAHLAPSINIVVYSGNKNAREMIRSLEFCEEEGCVMFEVLITSPDVLVEDLRYLDCLGWEGIIIDDYQKRDISKHFDMFANLSGFKLLISNAVPKGSGPAFSKENLVIGRNDYSSSQSAHAHGALEHDVVLYEEEPEQVYSEKEPAHSSRESEHVTTQLNNLRTSQSESSDRLQQMLEGSESIPQDGYNPDLLQNQMTMMSPWECIIVHSHQKRKSNFAKEFKKELKELRRKYNLLMVNEEAICNQHLKLVNELQCTDQKNQFLAELLNRNFAEPSRHGNSEEFQGQMGNLMQKLPMKDKSKIPDSASSSSSALPFHFPLPGMGPSSSVVIRENL